MQPRLPSFPALMGALQIANGPIFFGLFGYFALAFARPGFEDARAFFLRYFAVAVVLAPLVATPALLLAQRPLARLQRALDAGAPPGALDVADVRAALLLPRRAFWIVLVEWALFSLPSPLVAAALGVHSMSAMTRDVLVTAASMSFVGAVATFYAFTLLVSQRLAPVLVPGGSLDRLQPFRPVRTYHHLGMLVAVLGVCFPATMTTLGDASGGAWAGRYVGALLLLVGAAQTVAVLRAISRSIGHLEGRMADVGDGRLDVRARVEGLDTFGLLASHFNRMVEGLRQREMLREAFGRYVTKQVADEVLAGRVQLGGELRTATVLFSDIRGFTTMSERMEPTEVVAFLNRYLDVMVDCVIKHGGILDKFMGDAIMAVFGAPVSAGGPTEDAEAAVACALEMNERLEQINAERAARGEPPIEIGVGLHTGELVAGNIGSQKRMEYTVIGDTVNVSSRIEGLTKSIGRRILISAATARLVSDRFPLEKVAEAEVRGRARPVELYTPVRRG